MKLLISNQSLLRRLTRTAYWKVSTLPLGFAFATLIPMIPFGMWLAAILDIPPRVPVKDQPNGYLWIFIILSSFTALFLVGAAIGQILNIFLFHYLGKWTWLEIKRVFFYSEVPKNWLKPGKNTEQDAAANP